MKTYNKATLLGRLGRDPKDIGEGDRKVVVFPVATNERTVDKETGELKEYTDWHQIVAYGKYGDFCEETLSKGDRVFIEGKLKVGYYKLEEGPKLPKVEIMITEISAI